MDAEIAGCPDRDGVPFEEDEMTEAASWHEVEKTARHLKDAWSNDSSEAYEARAARARMKVVSYIGAAQEEVVGAQDPVDESRWKKKRVLVARRAMAMEIAHEWGVATMRGRNRRN